MTPRIVIDTNVFVSALRSQRGASFRLLSQVGTGRFDLVISVPLILEYEDVAKRQSQSLGLAHKYIDDILDYLCQAAECRPIFFLWRPYLRDLKDDMVLEVAVEGGCDSIVTFNLKDFDGIDRFGLRAVTPREFLKTIGEVS